MRATGPVSSSSFKLTKIPYDFVNMTDSKALSGPHLRAPGQIRPGQAREDQAHGQQEGFREIGLGEEGKMDLLCQF